MEIIEFTNQDGASKFADILLEKGEISGEEIWEAYNTSPRIPQVTNSKGKPVLLRVLLSLSLYLAELYAYFAATCDCT